VNGADWAFMGYRRPNDGSHLDGKFWVIGTNLATSFDLHEDHVWGFDRDLMERVPRWETIEHSIALTIRCRAYAVAMGDTYAEALQRCMEELERQDPNRKWYEPKEETKALDAGRPEIEGT
jgi:hypothetical protein